MTPKEKAKELVDSFKFTTRHITYNSMDEKSFSLDVRKKCALICVDEIRDADINQNLDWDYLYRVKKEIENV